MLRKPDGVLPQKTVTFAEAERVQGSGEGQGKATKGIKASGSGPGVARDRADGPKLTKAPAKAVPEKPLMPGKHMVVDDNTTMEDVRKTFGKNTDQKLRFKKKKDGTKLLYLHNPGKKSNLFNIHNRQAKHERAVDFLKQVVDREVGRGGAGDELLLGKTKLKTGAGVRGLEADSAMMASKEALKPRWDAFERDGGLAAKLDQWQDGRAARGRETKQDRADAIRDFKDGKPGVRGADRVFIPPEGAGGVLIARTEGRHGPTGVALKLEHPEMLKPANFVSALGDAINANVDEPLPFGMPKQEVVMLPVGSKARRDVEDALQEVADSGPSENAAGKLATFGDMLEEHGMAAKYELLDGGTLSSAPFEDRVAMFKSGALAHDLGKSALLTGAMGLCDHLSVAELPGYTNMSNMFLEKSGQVDVIDFDVRQREVATDTGEMRTLYGNDDAQVKKAVNDVLAFLDKALAAPDPEKFLAGEIENARKGTGSSSAAHPFEGILFATLAPGNTAMGTLFSDSGEQAVFGAVITPGEEKEFAAGLMRGALDSLVYLHDNAGGLAKAFGSVEKSAVQDPKGTFGEIRELTARASEMRDAFDAKFAG